MLCDGKNVTCAVCVCGSFGGGGVVLLEARALVVPHLQASLTQQVSAEEGGREGGRLQSLSAGRLKNVDSLGILR